MAISPWAPAEKPHSAADVDEAWRAYRFFAFDAWDSIGLCVVWPGLQSEHWVAEGFRRANLTVLDLEVDKAVRAALA